MPLIGLTPARVEAKTQPIAFSSLPPVVVEEEMNVLVGNKEVAERLYQEWVVEEARKKELAKRQIKPSGGFCSCVLFAKSLTGYSKLVGNARNWTKNSKVPVVGGVVITNESRAGHVAVITAIRDGEFDVVEANYSRCRKGVRTIKLTNPAILGYWVGA